MRRRWHWAVLLAPVAAVSCFSSDDPTDEGDDGDVTATVEMTSQSRFNPATVTIRVGEAVEWRNSASFNHTATLDPAKAENAANVALPSGAQTFDSGSLSPGATYRHTFRVAGTYKYFCDPHETFGMVGTVTVLP